MFRGVGLTMRGAPGSRPAEAKSLPSLDGTLEFREAAVRSGEVRAQNEMCVSRGLDDHRCRAYLRRPIPFPSSRTRSQRLRVTGAHGRQRLGRTGRSPLISRRHELAPLWPYSRGLPLSRSDWSLQIPELNEATGK